ncbi:hypothetical protein ADT26_16725 [Xanthomonas oryzae]|nr:hypothetical protein ADT26_16725 [Xanthomonas oryzae]
MLTNASTSARLPTANAVMVSAAFAVSQMPLWLKPWMNGLTSSIAKMFSPRIRQVAFSSL